MYKHKIIDFFNKNIKGKKPDVSKQNQRHDGKFGHWLEKQFNIAANADNQADLYGYELKNQTSGKTSFGDWSANYYIFNSGNYRNIFNKDLKVDNRNIFLTIFGKKNLEIEGRYSWSGEPCPNIYGFNKFGQKLVVESGNNDILAIYSFDCDQRPDKYEVVPQELQQNNLILARWYGNSVPKDKPFGVSGKCLKSKVEDKFNQNGWVTCKMNNEGVYDKICFGDPLTYDNWIEMVKKGIVFFDSGMYNQNERPYSQWRANNTLWDSLITECY